MFYAAMFDLFDVGLDEFIENFNGSWLIQAPVSHPFLSWLITLAAVFGRWFVRSVFAQRAARCCGGGLPAKSKRPVARGAGIRSAAA